MAYSTGILRYPKSAPVPELLWEGHNCHFGMEIGWTTYTLYDSHMLICTLLGNQIEIPTRQIGSVTVTRSLWQCITGTGTLSFKVANRDKRIVLLNILRPHKVAAVIRSAASLKKRYSGMYMIERK